MTGEKHPSDKSTLLTRLETELGPYERAYSDLCRQSSLLNSWLTQTLDGSIELGMAWAEQTDNLVVALLEKYSDFVSETFVAADLPSVDYRVLFPLQKTDPAVNTAIQSQYHEVVGATYQDFSARRDTVYLASGVMIQHNGSENGTAITEAIAECYGVETTCTDDTIARLEDYYLKHLWNDVYRVLRIAENRDELLEHHM